MVAAQILIVDDKSSCFFTEGYLREAGYATFCAAGGAEALRRWNDAP